MSKLRGAVRLGAAVCVAGLSLAGPQAVGVAVADTSGTGSADSSGADRPTAAKQSRAGRGGGRDGSAAPAPRAAAAETGSGRSRVGRGGGGDGSSAVVGSGRVNEAPSVSAVSKPAGPDRVAQPVVASPLVAGPASAAADVVAPAGLVSPVRPAAGLQPAIPVVSQAAMYRPPLLDRALTPLIVGFERALDVTGRWLSGFPANPVTDFLGGAVWLVRRTLFPVGDGVGLWGSAGCVATKDCSGQDLTGADLRYQDLTEVRFTNANLTRAILGQANLTRADLSGATLLHTTLSGANFTSANLSGTNLKYQDLLGATLAGANLTNANLTGARLVGRTAADLATATLVGANFTGQKFDSGNLAGTSLKWAGKDLTGVNLTGANMTGADLSRANLTGAELAGVNLTRANLTDATLPGPSFASPLVSATLVGANLTNVDLAGADLSGMNLTGTVLAGANLARTKLKSTNLTGAVLTDAILTGADLTGANLTRADLLRANMLNTTLTAVVWRNTRCQYGSKTSSGCSNVALLDQPPADWLQTASDRRPAPGKFWPWQWYQYGGPGVEPARHQYPAPIVRGTPGAPLVNAQFRDSADYPKYPDDGVQGMIYNDSGQRVVVRVPIPFTVDGQTDDEYYWSTAVLDPGDKVSYQLGARQGDALSASGGTLQFLRYDNGQTTGGAAKLSLEDPFSDYGPRTEFTPPGLTVPVNVRRDWKQEEQHSELWGDVNIEVRREIDGWQVTGSEEYLKYYKYTSAAATTDWAIMTIRIKGL